MEPRKGIPIVNIPITFDVSSKPQGLGNDKFLIAGLFFVVWILSVILCFFTDTIVFEKIRYILLSFIVVTLFVRFVVLREMYFMKKREDLIEKNYQYPYSLFWNIYEVTNSYPYICRYANGLKSIFVVFEKDVIVGREEDYDYYHFEAISNAYLQMHKRGIDCMHIDYMDTVGKDERVSSLFEMASKAENEDLSRILMRIFDNVNFIMEHSYASYDVYCFFYQGKDELFWDELRVVIDAFMEANYIRPKILNKDGIGELVKSVYNINNFSVNAASEKLFSDLGGSRYLTPIWIERNGEKKILNKTIEEKEAEMRVRNAEKNLTRKKYSGVDKKLQKMEENQEIDIFGNNSNNSNQNVWQNQNVQMDLNMNASFGNQYMVDGETENLSDSNLPKNFDENTEIDLF